MVGQEDFEVLCNVCLKTTIHRSFASHVRVIRTTEIPEVPHDKPMTLGHRFRLLVCSLCNNACMRVTGVETQWSVRQVTFGPSDFEPGYSTYQLDHLEAEQWETYYPPRHSHPPKEIANLPDSIKQVYLQCASAYNFGSFTLSIIGVRALLESVLKETVPNKPQPRLEALINHSYAPENVRAAMHGIRDLGNQAAHELSDPGAKRARKALEFLEVVLTFAYQSPTLD